MERKIDLHSSKHPDEHSPGFASAVTGVEHVILRQDAYSKYHSF
jgi:hypothetical protein